MISLLIVLLIQITQARYPCSADSYDFVEMIAQEFVSIF